MANLQERDRHVIGIIIIVVIVMTLFAAAYLIISSIVSNPFGYPWTIAEINKLFPIPIPQDAIDVEYSGHRGLGAFLNLEFKASSQSVDLFAVSICDSGLYKAYDPFNSINVAEPYTYAHRLQAGLFSYYSYSLNTPETIWGNRCGAQYQIRVDKSNLAAYQVRVQVFFSCNAVCYPIPTKVPSPPNYPGTFMHIAGLGHN